MATSDGAVLAGAFPLADALPDGIVVVDASGTIVMVNRRLCEMAGYSETELLGRSVDVLLPDDRREGHAALRAQFTSHPTLRPMGSDLAIVCRRKDGSAFPADIALSPLIVDEHLQIVAAVRDATDRRLAEEARHQVEERFRLLVEGAVGHAIFMLDTEGNVVSWNPGAERLEGYAADEVLGSHVSLFHLPDDVIAGRPQALLDQAAASGRADDFGWRVRKDGSRYQASVTITASVDDQGRLRGFGKMIRDITPALQARDDLARLQLLEQQERLGRDLHDGVIQSVFAVGMSLQGLLSRVSDPAVADRLTQAINALDATITELRGFIFGLGKPLTAHGIRAELEGLVTETRNRSGIDVSGVIDDSALAAVHEDAQNLLLVAREALSNVERHSHARSCQLSVRLETGAVELVVSDDGRGFDASSSSSGLGLSNARARAREIGADYSVESSGAGTTVRLRVRTSAD